MSEKLLWCNSNLYLCWHYSHFFSPCWLFGLNEEVLFIKQCEWVTKVSQVTSVADCHGLGKLTVRHLKCCLVQVSLLPPGQCPSCCYSWGFYGGLHVPRCSVCPFSLTEKKEALCTKKQAVPEPSAACPHGYFSNENISPLVSWWFQLRLVYQTYPFPEISCR